MDRPSTVRFALRSSTPCSDVLKYLDDCDDVKCAQQLADRSVLATFGSSETAQLFLVQDSVSIGGAVAVISQPGVVKKFVKVYYLPYEVSDVELDQFLSAYGRVYNIRRDCHPGYPNIENGIRTVTMNVLLDIPCYVQIAGFTVKCFHRGQKKTCRGCGSEDHLFENCDSVKCYHCFKQGHIARNCAVVLQCDHCGENHRSSRCQATHVGPSSSLPTHEVPTGKGESSSAGDKSWGGVMDQSEDSFPLTENVFSHLPVDEHMDVIAESRKRKVSELPDAPDVATPVEKAALPVKKVAPPVAKVVPPVRKATKSSVPTFDAAAVVWSPYEKENGIRASRISHESSFKSFVEYYSRNVYGTLKEVTANLKHGESGYLSTDVMMKIAYSKAVFSTMNTVNAQGRCRNCSGSGHFMKNCPRMTCFTCNDTAHKNDECLLSGQFAKDYIAYKMYKP